MASPPTDPLPGRRAGAFRIERRLAVGGTSEVFLARDDAGRRAVVKELLPHLAKDADARAAFAHEAALGQRLPHEGIVAVLEDGTAADPPYLVLEHVDGASLEEVLSARPGGLPIEAVLTAASDLLAALAHLHAATDEGAPLGVIHRDVSPDNALVGRDGRVRLADLGIARSRLRARRTRTGLVRGKAAYLAPEQITGSDVDARADLYSLGAVLFELATGRPHNPGTTDVELLRRAEDPVFTLPSELGADATLDPLLRRALERFPEDRPASARAMLRDVTALLDSLPPDAPTRGRAALAAAVEQANPRDTAPPPEKAESEAPKSEAPKSRAPESRAPESRAPESRAPESPGPGKPPPEGPRRRWWAVAATAAIGLGALAAGLRWGMPTPGAGQSSTEAASAQEPSDPAGAADTTSTPPSNQQASTTPTPSSPPGEPPTGSIAPPSAASTGAPPKTPSNDSALPTPSGPPSGAPSGSPTTSSTAPPTTSAPPPPTTTPTATSPSITRESVQRKMAAVSAALRAAKAAGRDVSALEARSALALQAFLDGRYADTDRELDAITAHLAR